VRAGASPRWPLRPADEKEERKIERRRSCGERRRNRTRSAWAFLRFCFSLVPTPRGKKKKKKRQE